MGSSPSQLVLKELEPQQVTIIHAGFSDGAVIDPVPNQTFAMILSSKRGMIATYCAIAGVSARLETDIPVTGST